MIHPKSWQSLRFILATLIPCAATQSSSASFLYPESTSSVLTINVYDFVNLEWTSNYDRAYLYLWCDANNGTGDQAECYEVTGGEVDTTGRGTFSPQERWDTSRGWNSPIACHFDIQYHDRGNDGLQGPLFTIVSDIDSAPTLYDQAFTSLLDPTTSGMTTISLESSSAITFSPESSVTTICEQSFTSHIAFTTSVITTTSMTPSSTTTRSPVSSVTTEKHNKTLSGGTITGIALGAAFAMVALVTVGWLFCRYHRRIKALETRMSGAGGPTGHPSHRSIPILPAEKRDRLQAELSELVA